MQIIRGNDLVKMYYLEPGVRIVHMLMSRGGEATAEGNLAAETMRGQGLIHGDEQAATDKLTTN